MSKWSLLGTGTATALIFSGGAAFADVSARDVWTQWTQSLEGLGYTFVTSGEQMAGDTLVVSDVVMSMTRPEGTFDMNVAEIRLKETGDGKVVVTMSNDIPIWATSTAEDMPPVNTTMMMRQQGYEMTVSGVPENMAYDVVATEIAVEGTGTGGDATNPEGEFVMTLRDIAGAYQLDTAKGQNITANFSASAFEMTASGTDPETNGMFDMSANVANSVSSFSGYMPDGVDMNDMTAAITAGFFGEGEVNMGASSFNMNFADETGPGSMASTGDGALLHFSLSGDGLEYGVDAGASTVQIMAPTLPLPIDVALSSTNFLMSMPIVKGEELQNFALKLGLGGLTVSESIWAMFDPTAQLPRTPAEMLIDVTGTVKLIANLFDPADLEANPVPGEMNAVTVHGLRVAAAGADLTGTGDFTFDNSMGIPMPMGAVDLRLIGAYALMDKLSAMGLLPAEQAAGFKAMLGLFAVPVGADELTSKIEMREDGGVYANGQRLQ
ncbi:DUF2125 domain-containing protein [Phaeovulum sp.]|uniref:DUF2125 domain-containing protein n=1 Tax=Phaeovulum sp. TaxID=2934796 RepID=UPI003562D073